MSDPLAFSDDEIATELERMRHFLDAVLEPDQLYEIRPVPFITGGSVWATPEEFAGHVPTLMAWNRAGANPYFSLNVRNHVGATRGSESAPGSVVVADFDNGLPLEAVRDKLAAAGLPSPTALVNTSPDHWHVYWRLTARLPGPFCNVKPDRPAHPRVKLVECDPNRVYDAAVFPMAAPEPTFEAVPLEQLAIAIDKGSLADASRAFIDSGILLPNKGRRASIYEVARDMHARQWSVGEAVKVLVAVGARLGLEPEDVADVPRQVKNAFAKPATPGYAVAEVATIDFTTSKPAAVGDDDYDAELEAMPLPAPPALPPRPELALSHGVIGDFMRRVEFETEAHPVALAATMLAALGNVIDRGPHSVVGRTRHGLNLFLAVVGNTGAGRKGTGGDIVADCIRAADTYWAEYCQSPNLVSGEGVIDAIRDRVEKIVPKKGGGPDEFETVVLDPGVADKRLLVTCAELVSAFKAGNRENSTLSQTLREAWDGKTLRTMAKNAARTATDPHLSIIGHATRHELVKVARESDIFGGTYNRFLFVLSERARLLPHGGNLDDLGTVPQRIADVVTFARTVERMRRTPDADRLWESIYGELTTTSGSDLLAAVLSRGEAQTLRLSMLFALAAGRAEITVDDLAAALDLWRYSRASATAIFAGIDDAMANRLVDLIEENPGITRSRLHKRAGWRIASPDLLAALARLRNSGRVRCEKVETRGRAAETWWPVDAGGTGVKGAIGALGAEASTLIAPNRPYHSLAPDQTSPGTLTGPALPAAPAVAWDPDQLAPGRYVL